MNRCLTSLLLLCSLCSAQSANWYVRHGAAGAANGTDWVHAWTDVTIINWDLVRPGDNVWIAGGSYGPMRIQATGATNQILYIARVRSTNAIPTQATGWDPSFDSPVIIDTISCNSIGFGNFTTIDGQVPYEGIVVTNTSTGCRDGTNSVDTYNLDLNGSSANYFTALNLDIGGRGSKNQKFGCGPDYTSTAEGRCFSDNGPVTAHGFRMAYCQLHHMGTLGLTGNQQDMTIEHSRLYSNLVGNPEMNHPNLWVAFGCTNVNFQFNVISNWQAEGIMFTPISATDPPNVNWFIHGNLWVDAIPFSAARILESQYTTNGPVYFCNNTCVNAGIGISTNGLLNYGHWSADCASSNNIYINTGNTVNTGFQTGKDDYNLSDLKLPEAHSLSGATTNIFVNAAARDYHIVRRIGQIHPRDKGMAQRPEFSKDLEGNVRGADGAWDIGAYEFQNPLQLLPLSIDSFGVTLRWQSASGSSYFVQRTANLAGGFSTIASNIPGQSITTSFTDTNASPKGRFYYRVGIQNNVTHYVTQNSTNPVPPYLSWDTAATNIQDAVDTAFAFSQVIVSNGVYQTGGRTVRGSLTNRVGVDKPIVIRSVNGPAVTIIQGYQVPSTTNGDSAIRCVYLTNDATLIGFTLTRGATRDAAGDPVLDQSGGGVLCETNSAVSNCVLIANSARSAGGGAYLGTFFNCRILSNSVTGVGSTGGGTCMSDLENCVLSGNRAAIGGAAFGGVLRNSTLAGNSASAIAGGTCNSTVRNSIVFWNNAAAAVNYSNCLFDYCCTLPMPSGIGNVTNAPLMVNYSSADFHLRPHSPCINAGNNAFASAGPDADGNSRITGGTVDIGAYEFQSPASLISIAWLVQYNLPLDGSADFSDADNDGLNNWQEWRAGTIPRDNTSLLRILAPTVEALGINVQWQSASGVTYYVQRSSDPTAPFVTLQNDIAGQSGITSYLDTNAPGNGPWFYRVGIQ